MIIKCIVENTSVNGLLPEHGLCLYIVTGDRRILFDTGSSGLFEENAKKMEVDISSADTAFISHGHYDHTGGLGRFMEINSHAPVYIRENAFEPHWHVYPDAAPRYIGMSGIGKDNVRLRYTTESGRIDESLSLITDVKGRRCYPETNRPLSCGGDGEYYLDDFSHEQSLVINDEGRLILICGCAHNGIVNILDKFREIYGKMPCAVVGGFHTMRKTGLTEKDISIIRETAAELAAYSCVYYTCHCTGVEGYEIFREVMGEKIAYISAGMEIKL